MSSHGSRDAPRAANGEQKVHVGPGEQRRYAHAAKRAWCVVNGSKTYIYGGPYVFWENN